VGQRTGRLVPSMVRALDIAYVVGIRRPTSPACVDVACVDVACVDVACVDVAYVDVACVGVTCVDVAFVVLYLLP
jgi:hypothetical protein